MSKLNLVRYQGKIEDLPNIMTSKIKVILKRKTSQIAYWWQNDEKDFIYYFPKWNSKSIDINYEGLVVEKDFIVHVERYIRDGFYVHILDPDK